MTKFTAFINNEEIELINYQGQACVNLLQAREATKRLLQDDVNASSAQVFAGNVPKGHIAITQRDPKLESHLSSFVCTGVL